MTQFVPLDVSIFDRSFTLDPFQYLKPLYAEKDVLGFSSEGMNFCFRFEDCKDLIGAHTHVAREPATTEETEAEFREFARRYPNRAWHFQYSLTDIKTKVILNRYLADLLDKIVLEDAAPVFGVLGEPGQHNDYLDVVRLLPMRLLLSAWGFEFDAAQLEKLYDASVALVKSFDNYDNEALIAEGEEGIAYNRAYMVEQFETANPGTLLHDFVKESRESGISDDHSIATMLTFMQATPNTISVSTAFMLRNILRFRDEVRPLRETPSLIDDNVILEFLRRDNHVKALSRQIHSSFVLRGREMNPGDSLYIFYPGINLDPTHWKNPLALDFQREFTRDNHNVFGGSRYACIGSRIALKYFAAILPGVLANLPESAQVIEDELEVDGDWIAERVITKLPIFVP